MLLWEVHTSRSLVEVLCTPHDLLLAARSWSLAEPLLAKPGRAEALGRMLDEALRAARVEYGHDSTDASEIEYQLGWLAPHRQSAAPRAASPV